MVPFFVARLRARADSIPSSIWILQRMSIPIGILIPAGTLSLMDDPMTRRLDRRAMKERTRQRLLDAAAAVFARRGIESASLDEVAEAAGYTKGAIYSNFASKTDLVIALIERRIAVQQEAAEAALDGMTLEQGLRSLDQLLRGGVDRDWFVLAVEFWLQGMRDERARAAMAERYEQARSVMAAILARKYSEAGEEPPMPPRELAIVFEALGIGVGVQSLLDPGGVSMGLHAKAIGLLLGTGRNPARGTAGDRAGDGDGAADRSPANIAGDRSGPGPAPG